MNRRARNGRSGTARSGRPSALAEKDRSITELSRAGRNWAARRLRLGHRPPPPAARLVHRTGDRSRGREHHPVTRSRGHAHAPTRVRTAHGRPVRGRPTARLPAAHPGGPPHRRARPDPHQAGALGVACGPLAWTALASGVGYPGTGALLTVLLAVGAGPLTLAALPHGPCRSLVPDPRPDGRPAAGPPTDPSPGPGPPPGGPSPTPPRRTPPTCAPLRSAPSPGSRSSAGRRRPPTRTGTGTAVAPPAPATPPAVPGTAPRRPPRTAVR